MASIYDFTARDIEGVERQLSDYRGKLLLIVNTASQCGFTYQYQGLEELHRKYVDKGVEVLGFPCNQFGKQEPGSEAEIKNFCSTNYKVTFPMTAKNAVTGAQAHPLYKWAVEEAGDAAAPRWNFHKYLIGANGELAGTFGSKVTPDDASLASAIEAELK